MAHAMGDAVGDAMEDVTEKITGAVPTQADILRPIGEGLSIGTAASVKEGDIPLDNILLCGEYGQP